MGYLQVYFDGSLSEKGWLDKQLEDPDFRAGFEKELARQLLEDETEQQPGASVGRRPFQPKARANDPEDQNPPTLPVGDKAQARQR